MPDIEFRKTTFTPAEAERISGVRVVQQRNLRRHGYLPKTPKGWTRYTLEETSRLLVIGTLATRGIPPATSKAVADSKRASIVVMLYALACTGAVSDPAGLNRHGERPVKHPPDLLCRFLIVCGSKKNQIAFEDDLAAFFDDNQEIDTSAAIVLDLKRLGQILFERAGRPLVEVREFDG